MPCCLEVLDFLCVRSSVLKQLQGWASDPNSTGFLFLSPQNLQYIFCEYVRRYEAETGWIIDPATYDLATYSRLIFELYWDGMCRYASWDPLVPPTRLQDAQLVAQWSDDAINAIVFQALKEARKKTNYLNRYRSALHGGYGRKTWDPVSVSKPVVSRRENQFRYNYTQLGSCANKYPVIDC